MPVLAALLTNLAERLTNYENYETHDGKLTQKPTRKRKDWLTVRLAHEAAFVQKIFVLNFITSYLPIFLTAFVYVPFGKILVPYLDVFQITAQKFVKNGKVATKSFQVDPGRLTKQVIYFTVTAQVVNFLLEVVVPYVKRKAFKAVKEEMAHHNGSAHPKDAPEEAAFLSRVRNEAELGVYDVAVDYREMVVQFGPSCPNPSSANGRRSLTLPC